MPKASYETAVTIQAPMEQVYNYLADFPRHVEWNHQPQEMFSLTEGPVRVGSRYKTEESTPSNMPTMQKVVMSVMWPMMKMMHSFEGYTVAEITTLEPNERVAWTAHMPNKKGEKLMQMHWEIRLQQQNGSTQVTQRCEVDPPENSPFAKMINENTAKQNRAETAANLERLKSILENRKN